MPLGAARMFSISSKVLTFVYAYTYVQFALQVWSLIKG